MSHCIDTAYFPGFVRKSFTFTIDDGNLPLDRKFLSIVRPRGILGTFNLCDTSRATPEEYRTLYQGYEIANHCYCHPFAIEQGDTSAVSDQPFSDKTADPALRYRTDISGLYYKKYANGWRRVAERDCYLRLVREGQEALEAVFGEGSVRSFVWPYFEQRDPQLVAEILSLGYRDVRRTGAVGDSTGFALPADRMHWSYTVDHNGLCEMAERYEAFADDGEMKFFCFGLHSHDYENNGLWDMLDQFARRFGNRPETFWYASVGAILDYQDAMRALQITDNAIHNPSAHTLYLTVDGDRLLLPPHSTQTL